MSALNMLTDQTSFAGSAFPGADTVGTGPSPFDTGPAFPGDFLGLSLQDEDNVWGLGPMSPTMPSWNSKPDQMFTNPNLDRDLKNSHVRNGQPTPPPYDDKKPDDMFSLGKGSWEDHAPENVDNRQRRSASDQSADSGSAKRRKIRENKQSSTANDNGGTETDEQKQEKLKREKFLERNRLAASKCRQKKKEHTMMLESRYKEQSDKKEELVAEIARLRSEILGLKNEVLKHAQCGDEPIKLHLAQMVKKITYNDAADFGDTVIAEHTDATDTTTSPSVQGAMSFGFDDPLQLEPPQAAESIEQQINRDSEASMTFTVDDNFDDLINV